jgi:tryptophan synthase beta chain
MLKNGRYGDFGGYYVPEVLMPVMEDIEAAFEKYHDDEAFKKEFAFLLSDYAGRPTPLYFCEAISERVGAKVYLKREDLMHGGAHKLNNTLGQCLLAKYMGHTKLIAETGAGQHGLATATVGAMMGMAVTIFMGEVDIERQLPNVQKMRLLGAKVITVKSGSATLKDAINEAFRYWTAHSTDTFYVFGTVAGPHPYPAIVRHFQSIIGRETKQQCLQQLGQLPNLVTACVGGGSNAIGMFAEFIDDPSVRLVGVEAAGHGVDTDKHACTLQKGRVGVLHGAKSYLLQDDDGLVIESHSISAGLDYPGIGPEHSHLKDSGRAEYVGATDDEVLETFLWLSRATGIIPAFESTHAVAWVLSQAGKFSSGDVIVINLSGRGDKDVDAYIRYRPDDVAGA